MKRLVFFLFLTLLASCSRPEIITLGTYNLHHCEPAQGGDRNYPAIAETIRQLAPDVIALQELDSCNARSAEFQAARLAELCGMEYLYHRTIPFGGGSYGIGLLYKPELGLVSSSFIPLPGEEPRGALIAEFDRFVYVCTHLCYQSEESRAQSFAILEKQLAAFRGKPVFVAGDLNSTNILDSLEHWTAFSTDSPTFTHTGSGARIDYILRLDNSASGCASLINSAAFTSAEGLSDHLPVLSTVSIK